MSRHGNRWTVNEILQLQREYELLELSVQEIATLHGRSVKAIQYRLIDEGFASWEQLEVIKDEDEDEDEESTVSADDNASEVSRLADRVWSLETSLTDISAMVKQMFNSMTTSNTTTSKKRPSLRSSV
jgi:hypothetical protein